MTDYVQDARYELDRAQTLYDGAYLLTLDAPGLANGSKRAGKPTSNPPRGVDYPLRAALVSAARHVAYGHHLCRDLGAPGTWLDDEATSTLGCWHVPLYDWLRLEVSDVEGVPTVVVREERERPVWTPEPSDLSVTPPTPDTFAWACQRMLDGMEWAATYGLDLGDLRHYARKAKWALVHVEKVRRIVRGDTGEEATWTDRLLRQVIGCDDCRDAGLCAAHERDVETAFLAGDLKAVEVWRGAEPPPDLPRVGERCAHHPACFRLRDGRNRCCQPCRKGYTKDCGRCAA